MNPVGSIVFHGRKHIFTLGSRFLLLNKMLRRRRSFSFLSHVPDGLFHPSFSPPPPPSVPIVVSPLILHFFFWLSSPPCPSHPSLVPECSFCSSSPFSFFILVICLSLLSRHLLSVAALLFQKLWCALKVLETYIWAKKRKKWVGVE